MKKKLSLVLVLLLFVPSLAIATDAVTNLKFGGEVRFRGYEMDNFWTFYDHSYMAGIDDRFSESRLSLKPFGKSSDRYQGLKSFVWPG